VYRIRHAEPVKRPGHERIGASCPDPCDITGPISRRVFVASAAAAAAAAASVAVSRLKRGPRCGWRALGQAVGRNSITAKTPR